jgi:hypothetical protein
MRIVHDKENVNRLTPGPPLPMNVASFICNQIRQLPTPAGFQTILFTIHHSPFTI